MRLFSWLCHILKQRFLLTLWEQLGPCTTTKLGLNAAFVRADDSREFTGSPFSLLRIAAASTRGQRGGRTGGVGWGGVGWGGEGWGGHKCPLF